MRAAALQHQGVGPRTVVDRCNWRLVLALAIDVGLWAGFGWLLDRSGAI